MLQDWVKNNTPTENERRQMANGGYRVERDGDVYRIYIPDYPIIPIYSYSNEQEACAVAWRLYKIKYS